MGTGGKEAMTWGRDRIALERLVCRECREEHEYGVGLYDADYHSACFPVQSPSYVSVPQTSQIKTRLSAISCCIYSESWLMVCLLLCFDQRVPGRCTVVLQ